jgi:hypothetical protein
MRRLVSVRGRILFLAMQACTTWCNNFYILFPEVLLNAYMQMYNSRINQYMVPFENFLFVDMGIFQSNALTCILRSLFPGHGSVVQYIVLLLVLPSLFFLYAISASAMRGRTQLSALRNDLMKALFWLVYLSYGAITSLTLQRLPAEIAFDSTFKSGSWLRRDYTASKDDPMYQRAC